jgi:ATP-dependent Clp protease ATP-binding subunit ClpA
MAELITQEVRNYFRPELLNRFDDQIVFHRLGAPEARSIAALMLRETTQRCADKGYTLKVGGGGGLVGRWRGAGGGG